MDFDLNYFSSGTGRPVLFQHGLGADINQTHGLLSGLEGIRLLSMDCRGHGKSALPANYVPSFDAYADDLIRFLDHLDVEQAVVGGISMGSGLALNIAVRYPDRVEALILVRPAWLDRGRPANLEILLDVAKYINQPDGKRQFEQTEEFRRLQSELPSAAASVIGQFSGNQGTAAPRILTHMFEDAPVRSLTDLRKIGQSCLVLGNHDDPLHPFDFATIIADALPNSEIKEVISRYVDDEKHRSEVRAHVASFLTKIKYRP